MKNLKFALLGFLALMFSFNALANTIVPDKQKIVILKFTDVQDVAQVPVIDFYLNYFVRENQFTPLQTSKSKLPSFAFIPDICWSSNVYLNNLIVYKEKLNSNYVIDKRKLLKIVVNQSNCLDC